MNIRMLTRMWLSINHEEIRGGVRQVAALEALYRDGHEGWNVRHFHDEVYMAEQGGTRSYTWVKNRLQEAGLVDRGGARARTGSGGSGSRQRARCCM